MGQRVVGILKLLRHEDLGIFIPHPQRCLQALVDACADIARVVDQDHFRAIVPDQFPALLTDRIGHDDNGLVAFHSAYERKADSLVAAGRFHDDRIRMDQSLLFRLLDHVERCPGLDGSAYIEAFHFHKDLRASFFRHSAQPDHGCVSDRFKYIVINHGLCSPFQSSIV